MMHALWEYDFVKPAGTRILGLLRSDRYGFVAFVGFFSVWVCCGWWQWVWVWVWV